MSISEREQLRRNWTVEVVGGDTDLGFDQWVERKVWGSEPRPLHKPPRMEDERGLVDGVFTFYDIDYSHPDERFRNEYDLEVVPQTTGNVELTCAGTMITIAHTDRLDLIRALLHDFHYSPERGGPNDSH